MPSQLTLSPATLYGFLLVLSRVAATFVFVPLPQLRQSSTAVRVVLSLAVTIALQSTWPITPVALGGEAAEIWMLIGRVAVEAGFGIAIGRCRPGLDHALPTIA